MQEHGVHDFEEAEGDEEEVDPAHAPRRDDERHGEERSHDSGGAVMSEDGTTLLGVISAGDAADCLMMAPRGARLAEIKDLGALE